MTLERRTARILMRPWTAADLEPFAEMNADPEVMRYFPAPLTRQESDALAARAQAWLEENGWGLWALEVDGRFAGFTGLARPSWNPSLTEVGWRLPRWAWGHGYATEAARQALAVGFDELGLTEVVSFTAVANERSRAVMRRLGMTRDPADDFDYPPRPEGHPLRRHVLYRVQAPGTSS
ncbi:GNAT family N-acetyltransferase [Cellulomonas wangsupingiae]|uniref:GNAT family N-acetyltransferase n=1 Tax=Cellulomonas wangsupingiae TaxID=2968085 RepID=A0ABY5K7F6_9CELL|nr:GNAT family N-acetyltransferase [Cellulomonas wangsupingiae]MCC2333815.1 GNAT family N-acetyltransferase [Cellulomonas wangsupingiae]UUI65077.1 GNAT family N-acetyltransferase [Cellulomonas wangsupingiae]